MEKIDEWHDRRSFEIHEYFEETRKRNAAELQRLAALGFEERVDWDYERISWRRPVDDDSFVELSVDDDGGWRCDLFINDEYDYSYTDFGVSPEDAMEKSREKFAIENREFESLFFPEEECRNG